jgi:hypothetical protein
LAIHAMMKFPVYSIWESKSYGASERDASQQHQQPLCWWTSGKTCAVGLSLFLHAGMIKNLVSSPALTSIYKGLDEVHSAWAFVGSFFLWRYADNEQFVLSQSQIQCSFEEQSIIVAKIVSLKKLP